MINTISMLVLPAVLCIAAIAFLRKKDALKAFTDGAVEGMKCCAELLPALILIMCSVNAMFSSGLADILCSVFSPVLSLIGIPEQTVPTVILRPFSGSGSTALADKLFSQSGADSLPSKISCLIMGSTDTLLYTLGMYLSAIKVKKTRHAVPASLTVFIFSIIICSIVGNLIYT